MAKYDVCIITTIHQDFDNRIYQRQANALLDAGLRVCIVAPWAFSKRHRTDYDFVETAFPKKRIDRIVHGWRTYKAARGVDASVYIFHDNDFLLWALRLKRALGRTVVYDAHENIPEDILYGKDWIPKPLRRPLSWAFRHVEEFVVRRLGETIVVGEYLQSRFRRVGAKAVLVRNFANFAPPSTDFANDRAILYTGDVTPDYGAYNILGIARHLKSRAINVPLRIVDRFPEPAFRASFLKTVSEEGLPIEVLRPVIAADMPQILARGCIGISPSPNLRNKALGPPTKLFEYMKFNLAVVGSDIEGTRIALEDGALGILCPPNDYDAWVDAIAKLLNDQHFHTALTKRARETAETKYTWDAERVGMTDYVSLLVTAARG
jgi:glycosyltransferase involved in cell wall biosynthesis